MKKTTKPIDGAVSAPGQSQQARPASGQASSRRKRYFGSRKRTLSTPTERSVQAQVNENAAKTVVPSAFKKNSQRSKQRSASQAAGRNMPAEKNRETLRIIPLGGQEEVGRNMTMFEYGSDIVILDMGLQFPEEDMPGIDYIIPNISYLKGKEKNIRGVILSHGHLDHIGAAPILLKKLSYPPIIGRDMTLALVKKKLEDFEKNSAQNLKTMRVNSVADKIRLGKFEINFLKWNIPLWMRSA